MWFYPLLVVVVILAIAGGALMGGVFTIILVPLAVIVLISTIVYALWGRALQGSGGVSTDATTVSDRPLSSQQAPSADGHEPASPEALVDARRESQ